MKGIIYITVKQLLGERLHRSLFFMALFALLGVPVVTQLSMFNIDKALLLYSMNVITFMGVLFAIFSVYILMSRDIGEKRIYYVLSMPVSRSVYLTGRFIGVALVGMLLLMFLVLLFSPFVLLYTGGKLRSLPLLFVHGFFVYLEMLMLFSIALIFLTLLDSPTVFVFFVTGIYAAGSNMRDAREFIMQSYSKVPSFSKWILDIFYYVFPNFSAFDWKMALVYSRMEIKTVVLLLFYSIVYAFVCLNISFVLFNQRELT